MENGAEKKENLKREGGKLTMEGGRVTKWGKVLFFFFFFFFFFAFHFSNHWNLFWVYQNGNFLPGKSISPLGNKSGKNTLPPLINIPFMPLFIMQRGLPILYWSFKVRANIHLRSFMYFKGSQLDAFSS